MSDYHGYPQGMPQPESSGGVDLLRKRRAAEPVTFGDVADHITDYVRLHPPVYAALDAFAKYLAEVEATPHDHNGPRAGSIGEDAGPPQPAD